MSFNSDRRTFLAANSSLAALRQGWRPPMRPARALLTRRRSGHGRQELRVTPYSSASAARALDPTRRRAATCSKGTNSPLSTSTMGTV